MIWASHRRKTRPAVPEWGKHRCHGRVTGKKNREKDFVLLQWEVQPGSDVELISSLLTSPCNLWCSRNAVTSLFSQGRASSACRDLEELQLLGSGSAALEHICSAWARAQEPGEAQAVLCRALQPLKRGCSSSELPALEKRCWVQSENTQGLLVNSLSQSGFFSPFHENWSLN